MEVMWKGSTLLLVVTQESADKGQDANETMILRTRKIRYV